MPWWTWTALAFFGVVLLASSVGAFVGFRRLRRAQARSAAMASAFEDLAFKAEALEQRALLIEDRRALLDERLARLHRSRERLAVLTWAFKDATSELTRLRRLLQK